MMIENNMKLLTKKELENLTTPRLLAYKNKLMQVPETPNWDEPTYRICKADVEWQQVYAVVKEVLATREHVERDNGSCRNDS
jgi:hypothetical protein